MNKLNIARNGVNYNKLMKAIRPFVSFDYDLREKLTSYERGKIKKYYLLIDELTAHPHQVYRARKKSNLIKVKEYAANPIKGFNEMKVAIVPNSGTKVKIHIKNNDVYTSTEHVNERTLLFNQKKLAVDTKAHVEETIARNKTAKRFTVKCGLHEQRLPQSRELIATHVEKMVMKYDGTEGTRHHSEWLIGLSAYSFKNQEEFNDQMQNKEKAAKEMQRDRKNERLRLMSVERKEKRKYGLYNIETKRLIKKFDDWETAFAAQQKANENGYKFMAKTVK